MHRASRGGSIKDLERNWEASYSVALALRQNTKMGFAGFATIVVALTIIDVRWFDRSDWQHLLKSSSGAFASKSDTG